MILSMKLYKTDRIFDTKEFGIAINIKNEVNYGTQNLFR